MDKRITKILFFIFLISFSSYSISASTHKKDNFALVISGGVSLGVYEAGLNWVLSEYAYQNENILELKTLTGASAGAVNTIFTAVRKCLDDSKIVGTELAQYSYKDIENNPFALGWRKLDISELIPDSADLYDKFSFPVDTKSADDAYRDGVVNRSVFSEILTIMDMFIHKPVFKENCSISIGMPVTRDVPVEFPIQNSSSESSLKMQRFSIPIIAFVDNNYLRFKNNIEYAENSPEYGYIFLPEDENGLVPFKNVVRAALTSSAFPIAFGRVQLTYCIRDDAALPTSELSTVRCPPSHHGAVYTFVDGGIFDNIPLGLAVDLTECTNPTEYLTNIFCAKNPRYAERPFVGYVFMDPDKRRNVKIRQKKSEQFSKDYDLLNQISFLSGSIEVARKDELYSTIVSDFSLSDDDKQRALLITRRYPPITAKYLSYFGAFLSQAFRDYDYYAGIYDGIINVALYNYRKQNNEPINYNVDFSKALVKVIGETSNNLVTGLGIKNNPRAFQVFSMLAYDEFDLANNTDQEWAWLRADEGKKPDFLNTFNFKLYQLLKKLETEDLSKSEFTLLLEGLQTIKDKHKDLPDVAAVYEKDLFLKDIDGVNSKMNSIAKRSLNRLQLLEDESREGYPFLMSLAELAVDARNEKHDLNTWKSDSTGSDASKWWWLLPNELSADVIQTGMVLTYFRNELSDFSTIGAVDDPLCYGYWEFEGLKFHIIRASNGKSDFYSSGINYRCSRKGVFSSLGLGYRFYYNMQDDNPNLDNNGQHGIGLSAGFLADKLRIGFEYRFLESRYQDETYLFTLGIADFRGIVSALAN